jgi:hypothetical protein
MESGRFQSVASRIAGRPLSEFREVQSDEEQGWGNRM